MRTTMNTRTPETGTPETGTPETGTPETGTPETRTPDARTADTRAPGHPTPLAGRGRGTGVRRPLVTVLAGAALCGATLLPGASSAAATDHHRPATVPERQLIASSTLGEDRRVTLTAVRSTEDETAATVRLATFVPGDSGWILEDRVVVGERDGWFWFPLTGSGAVCEFSTASAGDAPMAVSLLITPSIGCSGVHRFHIENGEIVPG